jgi:hypothetical protein
MPSYKPLVSSVKKSSNIGLLRRVDAVANTARPSIPPLPAYRQATDGLLP